MNALLCLSGMVYNSFSFEFNFKLITYIRLISKVQGVLLGLNKHTLGLCLQSCQYEWEISCFTIVYKPTTNLLPKYIS